MRSRSLALALLFLVSASVLADEELSTTGGSSVWADSGLTGSVDKTGTKVTVSTTENVSPNITATVLYQVGVVKDGTFNEIARYSRNLTAGNNQAVSNIFTALPQNTTFTVKAKTTYSDKS